MEQPDILQVLQDAQLAHRAGDFANALQFYEHFFEHALDDDPYALYGARLSHCLDGWGELAAVFPGAMIRLEAKRKESLAAYETAHHPERFHDYVSICRVLGVESEALEVFLALHQAQPSESAKLAKYLWSDLINAEQWQACSELMQSADLKLDELFAVFDEAARLKEFDPAFDNLKFEQHIVETLLTDVQKMALVLRHTRRVKELEPLQRQFQQKVAQRDHPILSKQAHAKGAFLFAGH